MNKEIEYITDIIYEFCGSNCGVVGDKDCRECKVRELIDYVRGS